MSLELIIFDILYYFSMALFVVVPAITAYWAYQAFRVSKRKGYLWIAVFALTPYFIFTINKISYQLHKDEIERMNVQSSDGTLIVERSITLPIYNLFLAAGVFSLARSEKQT